MLTSKQSAISLVSGNTQNRKAFVDDWQWSTRLPNPLSTPVATSVCNKGASYAGFTLLSMLWSYSSSNYYCYAFGSDTSQYTYSSNASNILAPCQAMHMACDAMPLPV